MASETIVKDIYNFLKNYPPFELIGTEDLKELSSHVTIIYYEKGEKLFNQGEKALPYFFVVYKGSIRISEGDGENATLVDECDEGDMFGVRASLADDTYIAHAFASEESIIYTIPLENFNQVMEKYPKVALYLAAGFASGATILKTGGTENLKNIKRFLDKNTNDQLDQFIEIDTIKINAVKKLIECTPEHTIREAAKIMSIFNVGSILVTDVEQRPLGIITDADFRRKVVSAEEAIKELPVTHIMSSPVKTIKPDVSVAEAMLSMVSNRVTHFCVTEDGTDKSKAIGVVSQRDILIAQGNNPSVLAKQILNTDDIFKIAAIREKAELLVLSYLQRDIGTPFIANIITEINDVLIQRSIEISIEQLKQEGFELPASKFCWLSLGSEGRREQLLRTDQDNAIIYEDAPESEAAFTSEYFLKLGKKVTDILIAAGFVKCKADVMASNPEWCQPVSVWQQYFSKWLGYPEPRSLMSVSIFFDFRPIWGNFELADNLKKYIFKELKGNSIFLAFLAKNALQNPPPLSFFRNFIVEKGGSHKNEFDIKARAMMPLADAARVLSYDLQLMMYGSTFERFAEIARIDPNLAPICESAAMAYEILLKQRAIHGLKNKNSGRFINPDDFNKLERQTIRNTFKTIEDIQKTLEFRYKLGYLR